MHPSQQSRCIKGLNTMAERYKIVRMYFKHPSKPVRGLRNLTLDEAQAHCRDPETSSRTCTKPENVARTRHMGPWFDSYQQQ